MNVKNNRLVFLCLATFFVFAGCKKNPGNGTPTPTPTPTAAPSPTPTPMIASPTKGPLTAKPNDYFFYDRAGAKTFLIGAIVCCEDAGTNGWPLVTDAALLQMAQNKANYTHIRLGPFIPDGNGNYQVGYKPLPNNQVDLDEWNPAFWLRVRQLLTKARSLGIYVEVDLIDAWTFKHSETSAWDPANNVNDVSLAWCGMVAQAPRPVHNTWLRKIVDETGEFDNVIYQIGNETFDCGRKVSTAWEFGVARTVRNQLSVRGFSPKLIGTNSHLAAVESSLEIDFIERHGDEMPTLAYGKPLMVNEYNHEGQDFFPERVEEGFRKSIHWHLWRSEMNQSFWESNLLALKTFVERHRFPR